MNFLTKLFLGLALFPVLSYSAEFFDNSTDAPHLGLIQNAHSSLDIEIYTMNDPAVHRAILVAQKRGVKVRIIQEPDTSSPTCRIFSQPSPKESADCPRLRSVVTSVKANGGTYVPYYKSAFCNGNKTCFEHGKMILIDRSVAMISTGNFDTTSLCDTAAGATRCNRDYAVVTRDPQQVQTLETIFENDLAGKTYDLKSIVDAIPEITLTVSPYSLSPLLAFIASAKTSIQVQNQYLHDADLNTALKEAAKRGVKIQVMVASICSFGKPSKSDTSKAVALANDFGAAGIDVRAFTSSVLVGGIAGYLHAKSIVVDHQQAWVGSVNGSTTALGVNREYGLFFNETSGVHALDGIMSSDFSSSGSNSLSDDAHCGDAFTSAP